VTFTNNNLITMENCTFFNVSASYGGHLRIRKNNIGNFKNINFTKGEALMGYFSFAFILKQRWSW